MSVLLTIDNITGVGSEDISLIILKGIIETLAPLSTMNVILVASFLSVSLVVAIPKRATEFARLVFQITVRW